MGEPEKVHIENSVPEKKESPVKTESPKRPPKATPPLDQKKVESFAPSNFQFTAPSGLNSFENYAKEFKFQPLSPASAANFFQGVTAFPSPKRKLITKDNFTPMAAVQDVVLDSEVPVQPINEGKLDKDQDSRKEDKFTEKNSAPIIDSGYFRNLVSSETTRLNDLCDKWEKELESDKNLTEEGILK